MATTAAAETKWSDAFLDAMRQVGDPPADNVIATLYADGGVMSVWNVMKKLIENDQPVPEDLPACLQQYLASTSAIPPVDPEIVAGGQELFAVLGPEMLMILAFYSLPASYSARKGVQVLYRTGYLNNRPNHRLLETTQMVMDVMMPGGLNGNARGVRAAQKVRLMHAATRYLIPHDPERPWPAEFGLPVNQEDLAGTLMVFAYLILEGLDRLAIDTTPPQRQGFLETWKVIGRLMGIHDDLIPADVAEAKELCARIQQRQVQVCDEGKSMTQALLKMTQDKMFPGPWRAWPAVLMRFFLPEEVSDGFQIPTNWFRQQLLRSKVQHRRAHPEEPYTSNVQSHLFHRIATVWIRSIVTLGLGGKRSPFILPTSLQHGWASSRFPSVWRQLIRR